MPEGTKERSRNFRPNLRAWRAGLALHAGLAARRASQLLGRGDGGMVGGTVALKLDPNLLRDLALKKRVVLVTGTNGKSTTTKMTVGALSSMGEVVANLGGDNMTPGILTALMVSPKAPFAVLEVDEMHLPQIADATDPAAIILLNLSRDQLDRVGEIGAVEKRIRQAVDSHPEALIVANCDDPMIVSAAWDAKNVVWVAAGSAWFADAASFPRTGSLVLRDGDSWYVEGDSTFKRPTPHWTIDKVNADGTFTLRGPKNITFEVELSLPGRANRGNSAQAAAAAIALGASESGVSAGLKKVESVAGRYQTYSVDGRDAHLLLAKNPAGWQEALTTISADARQVVVAVNGQVPDGEDLSWLWDVDFSPLKQLAPDTVIASGERAADLAVRLEYAGVPAATVDDPLAAIRQMRPGPVEVLANYTAFRDLKKAIENAGSTTKPSAAVKEGDR